MYQNTKFGIMGITKVSTNVVDNTFLVENTDKMMQYITTISDNK
jgi:hypothetical protein